MNVNMDDHNKKDDSNKSNNSLNNHSNSTNNYNEQNLLIKDVSNATENNFNNYLKNNNIKQQNNSNPSSIKDEDKSLSNKTPKKEQISENNIDNNDTFNYNYVFTSQNMLNNNENKESELKEINDCSTEGKSSDMDINEQNYIKYKLINNYKKWNGDNYFIFKGHMIEGPCSFRPTLMTGCALTVPTILFLSFNFQFMKNELSIIIPIIILIIYILSLIFLLIASFIDPGIIRRFNINIDHNDYFNFVRKESKIFHLGYVLNYKYCPSCGIIRPNRSTHCHDCNNCVERLDHHCPWIGNCAGKRNYKFFFIFLILLNILSILMITFCLIHIFLRVKYYSEILKKMNIKHVTAHSFCEVIISIYLIIYSVLTMCFITGLLIYHIKIILINSTTKEELKKIFDNNYGNPHKRNKWENFKNALNPKIKKNNILKILRGDFKEVCDYINRGNIFYKKKEKAKTEENDTQEQLKLNEIVNDRIKIGDSYPINEEAAYVEDYSDKLINLKNKNKNKDNKKFFFTERYNKIYPKFNIEKENDSNKYVSKSLLKNKCINLDKKENDLYNYYEINNKNNELKSLNIEDYNNLYGNSNSSININKNNGE